MDIETTNHSNLTSSTGDLSKNLDRSASSSQQNLDTVRTNSDTNLLLQTKGPNGSPTTTSDNSIMRKSRDDTAKAFSIGQSEERVQALSVIMLHLCTGLQYAQGVATQ